MTESEIRALYETRQGERREEIETKRRAVARTAYVRVAVFFAGVALLWFVWETDRVSWPWLLVPAAAFSGLMVRHARLGAELRQSASSERFYTRGLRRLDDEWAGEGNAGERYLDPKHPYAGDLDIFGKASLFELLDTTASPWGSEKLAAWLSGPASPAEARRRQEAVRELAPLVDLRDALASRTDRGDDGVESVDPGKLASWASAPARLTSSSKRWLAAGLGALTFASGLAWLVAWWNAHESELPLRVLFIAFALAAATFAFFHRDRVSRVLSGVEEPARELSVFSTLLERFENESFEADRLAELKRTLSSRGEPASSRIRRLGRLVDFLDARRNQLFAPFAATLLWGTQFAYALEAWRAESGADVPRWLDAVSELDALLALGAFSFEHPGDPFPTLREDGLVFDAEGIGHPLIRDETLVRNDVRFGDAPRLLVVSGSNMSGKSTFLRAVGVNTVLALAGAPVRARRLEVSPFAVAASIRIVDSLQDGISHFYAEILRLRQVLELASKDAPVLFLLDEILHGTNSHDRRIGAEAVVKGLLAKGAVGLVTTHDLALAKMADQMGDEAANVHFEDQIVDGKIRFDYVMRQGVVTKSNALDLMRSVGLEV